MNIYLVTRKEAYYGTSATRAMVVIAETEGFARRVHPGGPKWTWVSEEGVWANWDDEEMYRPKNDRRWPAPDDLDVVCLGQADAQLSSQVVLRDYER